ncbi:MAG: SRPBCC family protein [Bdellovibrionia bacterium]
MVLKIGLGMVAVVAGFLVYVGFQPADYTIKRETTINAPAEKIFPYLNNQKLAEQWGPWLEVDPQAKMNYSGPDEGVGAQASWNSSGQLGSGSATIVDSVPNEKVGIKLAYTKPMDMEQDSLYLISSAGAQTIVTWQVTGKNSFLGRAMGVFMDMDKMVGGMFEKGLSNLKTLAEK